MPSLFRMYTRPKPWGCALTLLAAATVACGHPTQAASPSSHDELTVRSELGQLRRATRANGTIEAVREVSVRVPQLRGHGGDLTLTRLVPSGTSVQAGDVLAEFDRTQQLQDARDDQAKYEDLRHQVDQKVAQNRSDAEQRHADLLSAAADFSKAELEMRKGPILSDIERAKDSIKRADAEAHVASLRRLDADDDKAAAADLRILELQRDRQKLEWERAQDNADKMVVKAPLAGMVALENTWRNGSLGHAQEGDQVYSGSPLLRVFDPQQMLVQVDVSEADGALLTPGAVATIHLDAYPKAEFTAHLETASPIATSPPFGSTVRTFAARFKLDQTAPELLPDLSAAVDFQGAAGPAMVLVPRCAVHYRSGRAFVTTVSADHRHQETEVQLGGYDAAHVAVSHGVEAGRSLLCTQEDGS